MIDYLLLTSSDNKALKRGDFNPLVNHTIRNIIVIVSFCTIAILYLIFSWSPVLAGFGGDNATYFLTAKLYSPFSESTSVTQFFASHSQYPPLFPLLLGFLGGGESILMAHLLTTFFLLFAMMVMYKWSLTLGHGKLHALLLVVIFAMIPGTYIQTLSIHSENLYLLLSLSGLYATQLKNSKSKWLWIAAFLIACSSLTRSAGLPLVLSFIIYLFINNERNRYSLSFAAIVPMITWGLFNNQNSTSYMTLFSEYYSSNIFTIFLQQLSAQSVHMLNVWHSTFTYGKFGHLLLSIFAGMCFIGMFYRVCKKKFDGIYAVLYLLMIFVWPYPAESKRLLFPLIPVLLVQTSICIKHFAKRWNKDYQLPIANIVTEAILLIVLIPNMLLTINRFNLFVDPYLLPYKRTYAWYNPYLPHAIFESRHNHVIISSLIDARKYVPEGQCVYSIKPSVVGVYMNRISEPPPVANISDEKFIKIIRQNNCRYFYLLSATSPSYSDAFYPYQRMGGKLEVIKIYQSLDDSEKYEVAILGKLKD